MVSAFRTALQGVGGVDRSKVIAILALYLSFPSLAYNKQVFVSAGDYASLGREDSKESSECGSSESSESCRGRMAQELLHVDFEVHGKVQGVFFRKYTQEEGNKLGLRGYCRNTSHGTVSGEIEGPRSMVDQMKHWLQYTGSPMSRISSANFMNEKVIDSYSFSPGFDIKRTV